MTKCSDSSLFYELCQLLNAIETLWKKKGSNRRPYIQQVASQWFSKYTSGSLFTLFRLALPGLDHSRVYGIMERRLALLSVRALGLEMTHRGDALLHWRDDSRPVHLQGDLSLIIQAVLTGEALAAKSTLSIIQVDELLTELAQTVYNSNNFASVQGRAAGILRSLLLGVTPMEGKWICRMVLKSWPDSVDFDPHLLFDAFHGWMWRMYRNMNDLRTCSNAIVELIGKGYHAPRSLEEDEWVGLTKGFFNPVLGTPIAHMACGRATSVDYVLEKFKGKQCWIETKYEGERLQAHLNSAWPNSIKIFSKGGKDSTGHRFGCHKYLIEALKVQSAIVEGEVLVFNEEKNIIEPFGTVQLFANRESRGISHLIVILYDLLFLNGESLIHRSLHERRQLLVQNTRVIPNFVEISALVPLDLRNADSESRKLLTESFEEFVKERKEGLLIKDISSAYVPNSRRYWLKLKKDYIEGFGDSAQFLVIGASYGKDHPTYLSELVIGCVLNKREVLEEGVKPMIQIVFSVSYGLKETDLVLLQNFLRGVKEGEASLLFDYLLCPVPLSVDYFLEKPLMAELLGSGFTKENGHTFFTLHFPRIKKIFLPENGRDYFLKSISFQELQEMAVHSNSPVNEKIAISVSPMIPVKREFQLVAKEVSALERHFSPSKAALPIFCNQEEVTRFFYIHDRTSTPKEEIERIEQMFGPSMKTLYTLHAVEQIEQSCYVIITMGEAPKLLPHWCIIVNL